MECCLPKVDADSSKLGKVQLGLFSASKPSSVSACGGRISVPAQQQGPRWYQEWSNLQEPLCEVNSSPNVCPSKFLEINVYTRVHTFCQNVVSQFFRWLYFALKEGRGVTPPVAVAAVVAASCLLSAAAWREMACPVQEEEAAVMPPLCQLKIKIYCSLSVTCCESC